MKRKISSLALMFLSMALTLHLTDSALRHAQETPPDADTKPVAERCSDYTNIWALPSGGRLRDRLEPAHVGLTDAGG